MLCWGPGLGNFYTRYPRTSSSCASRVRCCFAPPWGVSNLPPSFRGVCKANPSAVSLRRVCSRARSPTRFGGGLAQLKSYHLVVVGRQQSGAVLCNPGIAPPLDADSFLRSNRLFCVFLHVSAQSGQGINGENGESGICRRKSDAVPQVTGVAAVTTPRASIVPGDIRESSITCTLVGGAGFEWTTGISQENWVDVYGAKHTQGSRGVWGFAGGGREWPPGVATDR